MLPGAKGVAYRNIEHDVCSFTPSRQVLCLLCNVADDDTNGGLVGRCAATRKDELPYSPL